MADKDITEVAGLQLSNNTFSASPPGSLLLAKNIVINNKGVGEHRNGQANTATLDGGPTFIPWAMTPFQGGVVVASAPVLQSTGWELGYVDGSTTQSYTGTYDPPDVGAVGRRLRFAGFNQFLNFCTSTGPKALEDIAGEPRQAGLLRMPDPSVRMLSTSSPGATGWLPYGATVAYRTVLRMPTATGVSLLSPPSGRAVVTNRILAPVGGMVRTGGNTVTVTIPGQSPLTLGLGVGDSFTLTPGEANFAAGAYTVASVSGTPGIFTYTDAGANVSNTVEQDFDTGPRAVQVNVRFSADTTTSTPWRIYRSLYTTSATVEPSDELFLDNEAYPSSGQISAGFVAYQDVTPQSVLSTDPLYTNPQTGEGLAQSNFQPPIYRDVASWGQRLWFANTRGQQQMRVRLLGVGTPDGVQANDTFTVSLATFGSTTVTFKATASAAGEVAIVSNATPSVNVLRTAQNLVRVLNTQFASGNVPIRAYYNSGQNDGPGQILLETTNFSDTSFGVTASRPSSWTPALRNAIDTSSVADRQPNGLAYSKLAQGEAVGATNFTTVGSANYEIGRIFGLRNALIVCKAGDGIYSLTGSGPFVVEQIATANILATDAAAIFSDCVWVYTDEGVLRVSDSGGAVVVSRPIETELNRLYNLRPEDTASLAFAVPHETERRIMFFVPFDDYDAATQNPVMRAWCYSNATNGWSGPLEFQITPYCGVVTPDRRLWLGGFDETAETGRLTTERKGNTPAYLNKADADRAVTITLTEVDDDPLHVQLSEEVAIGSGLEQGQWRSKVVRFVHGANVYEVADEVPWEVGAASIYEPYEVTLNWQPQGSPSSRKALTRMAAFYQPESYSTLLAEATLMTDQIQALVGIPAPSTGFGLTPFGQGLFGNPSPLVVDTNPLPPSHTNAAQFFPGIAFTEVWCNFRLQGVGLELDNATAPVGRGR